MRRDLPSGTVTFLFTDVEGSTRLLHTLGAEAYAEELEEHRRVIRAACADEGGVEVDTQGDAFFFAFRTPEAALEAARKTTQALASGPIKVRIGLHTGTPHVTSQGYVGADVHRAARIAAAGHGGQVLVSEQAAELLGPSEGLVSLGAHRLKDFEGAVRLYQLGEVSFPAVKTIANTNLPSPASSFLGREAELLEADLSLQETRLLTVTGPGGAGKTRFALELARRAREERFSDYEDGVFSCFLASLRDPALVLPTIAQTLSVREDPGSAALATLSSHLASKKLLLLLDNLEHVLDCARELSELLASCPDLTLLVTSRELMRLQGELPYALPALAETEGVALFCERAHTEPTSTIAELCTRLDGLPLAIELAAARMGLLSAEQLFERLSGRLDLLKGARDADPRQQTLRATVQWSDDLLSERDQQLFTRLSVFVGGCTLQAAEEVAEADLDALESLLDKSLLRRQDTDSGPRFWMLETIREYAAERLETSSEAEARRAQHAALYARLAIDLSVPVRQYSHSARAELERELDNTRVALNFALLRDDVVLAGELLAGLWFFWLSSARGDEARTWAERYMASSRARASRLDRLLGDNAVSEILRFTGDPDTAASLKRDLIETGRAHPDEVRYGRPIKNMVANLLRDLALMELDVGQMEDARSHAAEALALRHELGRPAGIGHALTAVAAVEYHRRAFGRAREVYAEAAAAFEAGGFNTEGLEVRLAVAECELLLGRPDEAESVFREALESEPDLDDYEIETHALRVAAMLAASRGDARRSALLFGALDGKARGSAITLFGRLEEELQRSFLERAKEDLGDAQFQVEYERGSSEWERVGRIALDLVADDADPR